MVISTHNQRQASLQIFLIFAVMKYFCKSTQEVSISMVPSDKKLIDFSTGFWINAENKLCGKQ